MVISSNSGGLVLPVGLPEQLTSVAQDVLQAEEELDYTVQPFVVIAVRLLTQVFRQVISDCRLLFHGDQDRELFDWHFKALANGLTDFHVLLLTIESIDELRQRHALDIWLSITSLAEQALQLIHLVVADEPLSRQHQIELFVQIVVAYQMNCEVTPVFRVQGGGHAVQDELFE